MKILDACCGSKMFWFDKENPNVTYMDIRRYSDILCDGRKLEVNPVITTGVRVKYFTCLGLYNSLEAMKKLNMKFEENRFFPVQYANLIKMEVKK